MRTETSLPAPGWRALKAGCYVSASVLEERKGVKAPAERRLICIWREETGLGIDLQLDLERKEKYQSKKERTFTKAKERSYVRAHMHKDV